MSSYDKARRQSVDPRGVHTNHKLSAKHVEAYRNGAKADGAEPFLVIDEHGRRYWANGAHRAEAARLQGKNVTARVHDVRKSGALVAGTEGCMVMTVGLVMFVVVAVGLIRRGR